MADTKTNYIWSYDLVENMMTKDVKEDYVAAIQTKKSLTIADIAAAISAERTEYRVDTIVNIGTLIDEKIRQLLCDGYTIVTGSAQYAPSLSGVFIGDTGVIDPAVNKCAVNIIITEHKHKFFTAPPAYINILQAKRFSHNLRNILQYIVTA